MKNQVQDYNINELASMRIIYAENFAKRLIGNTRVEYENYRTYPIDDPDLVVRFGRFKEKKDHCQILDNKYFVRDDYLFCKDSYREAKWKIEINGMDTEKIQINVSFNSIASLSISGFVIDPLLNILLNRKGLSLVHASGACKNGNAYLFTSQGGGGKTSTALNLSEKGFEFMGDNYTILDKGHALGFLSPLNVFSFNLLPSLKKRMGSAKSIEYQIKHSLHKVSGLRIVTKVNPRKVFRTEDKRQKLRAVFQLVPRDRVNIRPISLEELCDRMLWNMRLDTSFFDKYLMEYSYAFPESSLASHWKTYRENLMSNIGKDADLCLVEVLKRYDNDSFFEIFEKVEGYEKA